MQRISARFRRDALATRLSRLQNVLWQLMPISRETFALLLGFVFVVLLISVLFRNLAPNATIGGASVSCWAVFIGILLILWPICAFVMMTIEYILRCLSFHVLLFYIEGSHEYFSFFLWCICLQIAWDVVFDLNPFPAYASDGTERKRDTLFLLDRIVVCTLIFSIILCFKGLLVRYFSIRLRTRDYYERVQESVEAGDTIAALTANMSVSRFEDSLGPEHHAAAAVQRAFRTMLARKKSVFHGASHFRISEPRRTTPVSPRPPSTTPLSPSASSQPLPTTATTSASTSVPLLPVPEIPLPTRARSARPTVRLPPLPAAATAAARSMSPVRSASPGRPSNGNGGGNGNGNGSGVSSPLRRQPSADVRIQINPMLSEEHAPRSPGPEADMRFDDDDNDDLAEYLDDYRDLRRLRFDDSLVHRRMIEACNGLKLITSSQIAADLGLALFAEYAPHVSSATVPISAFERAYPNDPAGFRIAKKIFDPNDTGEMTREWLVERCVTLYRDRKCLSQSVSDLNSVVHALSSFLSAATGFVMFFVVLVLFAQGDYSQITVSLGTTLLAFSFIFSDTAKNVFNSFVFIFIRHPYDVGDKVTLDKDSTPIFVARIELMTSYFRVWDGRALSIPNYILHGMGIYNINRSGGQTDTFTFTMDYRTPMAVITKLGEDFMEYCKSLPNDYKGDKCGWYLRDIKDSTGLTIEFYTAQQNNWQNGPHYPRRHELMKFLKERCEHYKIEYFQPTQRATVTLPENLHFTLPTGESNA